MAAIIKMYQAIEELLLGQQLRIIGLPDATKNGISEHQKIYHAIQNHDAGAAQTAMRNHMVNTQARILNNLKKDES
jgi:DNA-binding FadR family transcriptional regulator